MTHLFNLLAGEPMCVNWNGYGLGDNLCLLFYGLSRGPWSCPTESLLVWWSLCARGTVWDGSVNGTGSFAPAQSHAQKAANRKLLSPHMFDFKRRLEKW